jgi:hypothetical protein
MDHRTDERAGARAAADQTGRGVLRPATDWRAALREFAVILASVLTALLAQAWWQQREEQRRELDYLRQLLADTRENEARLDRVIAQDSAFGVAAANAMAALVGAVPLPPADTLDAWTSGAVSSADFRPLLGTFRALIGSGDLRLVRNDTLRAALTDYLARLDAETARQRDIRVAVLQQLGTFARAYPPAYGAFLPRGSVPPSDLRRLRGDRGALSSLFVFQAANANRLYGLRALRASTIAMQRVLKAEPGVGGGPSPASPAPTRAAPGE